MGPIVCGTCMGLSALPLPCPRHPMAGRCPCGNESGPCPDCEGTGNAQCTVCGDADAVTVLDGEFTCSACATEQLQAIR